MCNAPHSLPSRNVSDLKIQPKRIRENLLRGMDVSEALLLQVSYENSDTGDTLKTCPDYLRAGMHSRDNDSLERGGGKESGFLHFY